MVSEQLVEASALAASSLLRPPLLTEWADPIPAWFEAFSQLVVPREPHLLRAVSFARIQPCTDAIFPAEEVHDLRLLHYSNVLFVQAHGALFDATTGLALPGTFLTRFPYQREAPACSEFRMEITGPTSIFPSLDRAVLIPSANCSDFGHFITETMAFLWPLFMDSRSEFEGYPVLLRGCDFQESAASMLFALLRGVHAFPVLEQDLPSVVYLKEVVVPEPSLRLQACWSPHHLRTLSGLGDWILSSHPHPQSVPTDCRLIYLSRSGLGPHSRCVDQEEALEACLKQMGWCVVHPELHSLAELLAVIRAAKVLSGFESSALHVLGCIDSSLQLPAVILLGDCPSPDYFLQFRVQRQPGFFIHCTRLDPGSEEPATMRPRLLNCAAESLAQMIHDLATGCLLDVP